MLASAISRRACRSAALAFALSVPLVADAQAARDSVTLPRELLLALLGNANARDRAVLTVGDVPPDFPPALVTARGATVLGGITHGVSGASSDVRRGTAMLVLDLPPDSAAAIVAGSLERAGWRRPAPPPSMRERGGFVPSTMPIRMTTLCRGESVVTLAPSVRQAGGSYVRATLGTSRLSLCDPEVAARTSAPMYADDFPIPALTPPPGVRTVGGGNSQSSSSSGLSGGDERVEERTVSTLLATALSPDSVVAHYVAQLAAAGWTVGAATRAEGVAMRVLAFRDDQGRTVQGVLTGAAVPGASERSVTLHVLRRGPRR